MSEHRRPRHEQRALQTLLAHAEREPVPVTTLARYVTAASLGTSAFAHRMIRWAVAHKLLEQATAIRGSQRFPGVRITLEGACYVQRENESHA